MAGKKQTTKNLKNPESEVVVSDSETNGDVVSDSEQSESFEVSLKSQLGKKVEKSRKIEANQSKKGAKSEKPNSKINKVEEALVSESESEGEEDEEVEESEGEEEVEESEGEKVRKIEESRKIEGDKTSIRSKMKVVFERPDREVISESESEGEEDEEVDESEGEEVEESEGEKEEKVKKIERNNGGEKSKGKGNGKMSDKKGKGKGKGKEVEEIESESGMYKLPMRRISRIIKDDNPDMRITHEATFLINKATEKFLELFAKEAFACAFVDRKNLVAYNHLSSVVAKRSKLNFLSDFVPEKVKAEVALAKFSMKEK